MIDHPLRPEPSQPWPSQRVSPRLAAGRPQAGTSPLLGLLLAALLPALFATGCGSPEEQPAAQQRWDLAGAAEGYNVLLLTVDTVRADRLGAYGYELRDTTPEIDRLLASGVTFERAVAPRSLTWPSLASVFTGLYPSGHGVLENGYEFPDDLTLLSEALQGAGYTTAAFLSNMCRANHQGWGSFACSGGRDGVTLDRALGWASELPTGGEAEARPFFLWVHLFAAHGPYYNGGDLAATELDPGYEGPLGPTKWQLDPVMEEGLELTERDLRHLDALYDAALMGTDYVSGKLLAELERMGLLEDTLVVFLSDHGEELYQHNGYLYHACSVYESTLHVPFGISGVPGLPAGGRVPQPVELVDVAPTVYELLGLGPPGQMHGASLVPYLERPGAGGKGKPAFSEYGNAPIFTVVEDGWKLIHNPEDIDPYCFPGAPRDHYPLEPVELYHLTEDPMETTNLADAHPARVRRLQERIRDRFSGLVVRGEEQELPDELKEQLRALGYVAD